MNPWWALALVLGGLIGLAALGIFIGIVEGSRRLVRPRRVVLLPRLPAALEGFTILHLSDLHVHARGRRVAGLLRRAASLRADMLVVTGDFIQSDGDVEACVRLLEPYLGDAPAFAVLGNHDHFRYARRLFFQSSHPTGPNDASLLMRTLERRGLAFLVNRGILLEVRGEAVWVGGVDDPYTYRDKVAQALEGAPGGAFKLLLAHSPDVVYAAQECGVDLVLAGHTHGGQVRLPLIGPLTTHLHHRLESAMGLSYYGRTALYINAGIGTVGIPMRFLCPPEATILELRRAEG